MEHLYDKLKEYSQSDFYPYHMPGHKRRMIGHMPEDMIAMDITEIPGFDDLHEAEGILKTLQEEAAKLYGADESFYLVNGSSCGVLTAISAAVPFGGKLLMARNCHKSAYHAIYLRHIDVKYMYPSTMDDIEICEAITPDDVESALLEYPDVDAVLIVSPTYEGRISDVKRIAQIVHEKGIPLIVDGAHGAHLGFHDMFHENSCREGADIVIHSVHKTLPAMTQTALLHVCGNLVSPESVKRFLHIYQSSSPSYVMMAGIDNALSIVRDNPTQLFTQFYNRFCHMLTKLKACKVLKILPCMEDISAESKKHDVGKLIIASRNSAVNGQYLYDILKDKYHLQLEMAGGRFCLAMFTIADGDEAYLRMTNALLKIDEKLATSQEILSAEECLYGEHLDGERLGRKYFGEHIKREISSEHLKPIYEAWDMEKITVPLSEAIGKYAGEFINLYPPGTPILVPGEIITEDIIDTVRKYFAMELNVQGIYRSGNDLMIRVIK